MFLNAENSKLRSRCLTVESVTILRMKNTRKILKETLPIPKKDTAMTRQATAALI